MEEMRRTQIGIGGAVARSPPGGRGGYPHPAPTERSVQISRTALVRSWFTARR
jgi:hypothetical protein